MGQKKRQQSSKSDIVDCEHPIDSLGRYRKHFLRIFLFKIQGFIVKEST